MVALMLMLLTEVCVVQVGWAFMPTNQLQATDLFKSYSAGAHLYCRKILYNRASAELLEFAAVLVEISN